MIARRASAQNAAGNFITQRMQVQVKCRTPSRALARRNYCDAAFPVSLPCMHASLAVFAFRWVKQLDRSIFRQSFATAAEPEPLIINHQFVILPAGP
jgi:hypothetical protein